MTIDPGLHDRGEKVLWWGRPNPPSYAFKKSWQTFLFGIPFLAFAVFWTTMASAGGAFAAFGIPFMAIGLGMVLSPLWYYVRGLRTTYALTDRRAVIDIAGFMPQRISVPLSEIDFIDLRARDSGSGDVYFKETVSRGSSRNQFVYRDGFVAIPEARRVEALLRNAVDASRRPVTP
jgi:hypothetical protein